MTLLSAPIEVGGDWGKSLPNSALTVIQRMRDVCLTGVELVSDQPPDRIRIDDHPSGSPSIWLHYDNSRTAWVIVDVGERDWSKLAYQFGHELGHVLCNSWASTAKPQPPSQWLEESLVEAFSFRGLGRLANSWKEDPPFPGDNAFSGAIANYRQQVMRSYENSVDRSAYADFGDWFQKSRVALERPGLGLNPIEAPAILEIAALLDSDDACVADMAALNRWPERTAVPLEDYLKLWQTSCVEVRAPGVLPTRLKTLFRLGDNRS